MATTHELQTISDDDLLRRLSELLQQSRRVESELVVHIGEVDARRLYARRTSSMYVYCREVLGLSEWEAYHRIAVARAARQHPILLEMPRDGRLHLSGIAKLAPHLTESNREKVLTCAVHKSKRQIEELVAELAPQADVPTVVRKLPPRKCTPLLNPVVAPKPKNLLGPDQVAKRTAPVPARAPVKAVEPLAPSRYKIQFTASAELHEKLRRLSAMTGSSDLATVIEQAVTEKLERLEARRYGKTDKPRKSLEKTDTTPSSRYIPAAVRRAVAKRDGEQCRYVDEQGRRCTSRDRLEFHHCRPFAYGGSHSADNIVLMCRAHNNHLAERDYGREKMARYRHSSVSEPLAVYALAIRTPRSPPLACSYAMRELTLPHLAVCSSAWQKPKVRPTVRDRRRGQYQPNPSH